MKGKNRGEGGCQGTQGMGWQHKWGGSAGETGWVFRKQMGKNGKEYKLKE